MLEYCWSPDLQIDRDQVVHPALISGNMKILKWLAEPPHQFLRFDKEEFKIAMKKEPKMRVLKWLRAKGTPFSNDCVSKAIKKYDRPLLMWLLNEGAGW